MSHQAGSTTEKFLEGKTDLVRRRICKLWRSCQWWKGRGGVEARLSRAGHGAGGGIETHGHPPAGLAERQGEGGGLAELTDLENYSSQVKLVPRALSPDCIKKEGRRR